MPVIDSFSVGSINIHELHARFDLGLHYSNDTAETSLKSTHSIPFMSLRFKYWVQKTTSTLPRDRITRWKASKNSGQPIGGKVSRYATTHNATE